MKKYLDHIELTFKQLTNPLFKIVELIQQFIKNYSFNEVFQSNKAFLSHQNLEDDYNFIVETLYFNLNKVSLKMETELNKISNQFKLVFQQLKNVSKAIEKESNKRNKKKSNDMDCFNYSNNLEIESLVQYFDQCLHENFGNMKQYISQYFKNPKKQLSFSYQVINISIPNNEKSTPNAFEEIISIFEQNPRKENDIKSNLFKKELSVNKNIFNKQIRSETNMSATTDKQNNLSKKLIQSDPQSNIINSGAVIQQQQRGYQSPRTLFNTPLPKNNRIRLYNQMNQKDKNLNPQSKENILMQREQNNIISSNDQQQQNVKTKIENSNQTVQYSGSFSDRITQDEGIQFPKFFKKKPLQLNISEKSDSRNSNQRDEQPIFQSPNFNGLLTKENINKAFNNNQQSQSQLTVYSRDLSTSNIHHNLDLNNSISIKTREIDPIINGSGNDDQSQDFEQDFYNQSASEKRYYKKLENYF